MLLKTKVLILFMTSSLALYPSGTEAKTQLPQTDNTLSDKPAGRENRPAGRGHPYGGTLVWGEVHKPTIINPILTQSSVSASLMGLIFDPLVRVDSKGQIVPALAESWDVSDDGLEYTFYLRTDAKFHDGADLTADDVVFTYQQVVDPANDSPFRAQYDLVEKFEAVGNNIFKIYLSKPFPPLLSKLLLEIIPKHLLEGEDLNTTRFNDNPVGSGPFQFKEWDQESGRVELIANPQYFEGRPYLDNIIVKTYSDDAKLWAAFMRREVDLMLFIKQEDYTVIEHDPAFRAYAVPGSMYYALVYNLNDPVWRDRELREAVARGIDIEGIINALPRFEGVKATGPFHPQSVGYNHEVRPYAFDSVKAKMMLMHRGWQDMPQDAHAAEAGIREKDGRQLEVRMLVDGRNDTYHRMAQIIRQQLAEIGIKLVILLYEDERELTPEYMARQKPQAWLRQFQGLSLDPYEATAAWYSFSSEFGKFGNYKSTEIDRLIEEGKSTRDVDERNAIYKTIHQVIYEDQPACFLFYPAGYFAVNVDFKNTDAYFSVFMPTYTLKDWYYSDTRKPPTLVVG